MFYFLSDDYTFLKLAHGFNILFLNLYQKIQNMKDVIKEITPIAPEDLFIVLDHPDADFDYPVHYHPEYEINLVMNTYGKRIVGDSIEPFEDLDLVMTGPNLAHAWRGEVVKGNHVITIQFSDELLSMPIMSKRLFSNIKKLLVDSQRGICFSKKVQQNVKDKIINITRIQGFQTVLEFLSLLYELSISDRYALVSSRYDMQETILTSKSRRIEKVCNYMKNHFTEDITLADVAQLVGMSDSAFSHFFKGKTNSTFIDYLNNLRITYACQLLVDTSQTVAEICYHCGFNNMSNFIRMFKRKKAMTPNEYRTFISQMLIKY